MSSPYEPLGFSYLARAYDADLNGQMARHLEGVAGQYDSCSDIAIKNRETAKKLREEADKLREQNRRCL